MTGCVSENSDFYVWLFPLKMLHPQNPTDWATQIPLYLAVQIQIEILVKFEFVPRNLGIPKFQQIAIWWISGVEHVEWNVSYTIFSQVVLHDEVCGWEYAYVYVWVTVELFMCVWVRVELFLYILWTQNFAWWGVWVRRASHFWSCIECMIRCGSENIHIDVGVRIYI